MEGSQELGLPDKLPVTETASKNGREKRYLSVQKDRRVECNNWFGEINVGRLRYQPMIQQRWVCEKQTLPLSDYKELARKANYYPPLSTDCNETLDYHTL